MKILITGAYGMLGSDLREVLKNHELIVTGSKDLDITNEENVIDFIDENSPEVVINAAAYTAVDDCETNYDEAYAVNAIGPKNLAIACKKQDVPYTSSVCIKKFKIFKKVVALFIAVMYNSVNLLAR